MAVKLFRLDLPPDRVHRLVAELEQLVAADLTHPSIATPIAAGLAGVTAYLAQDFVAADSLDVLLRDRRTLTPFDVLRVIGQVAGALDMAAAGRIVHGALHPRDLLVSPDDVRVTGVGIARALERAGLTAPVRRPYTAPERVGGRAWDRRADVFSLGVLAHEMLWGRRPSTTGARAADDLTDIAGADLPALRAVFARVLAETFTERFDTAERFADGLRAALGPAAEAGDVAPPVAEPRRRHPAPGEPGESVGRLEADRGLFDVDQFRDTDGQEPFLPESVLALSSIEAQADPGGETESATTSAPIVLEASPPADALPPPAASEQVLASAPSDQGPPDASAARPPKTIARRDRLAPSDARGVRAEGLLFVDAAPDSAGVHGDVPAQADRPFATADRAGSAVWPLAMALGVGLAIGFAGGYGLGGGQRDRSPAAAEGPSAVVPAGSPRPAVERPTAPEPPSSTAAQTSEQGPPTRSAVATETPRVAPSLPPDPARASATVPTPPPRAARPPAPARPTPERAASPRPSAPQRPTPTPALSELSTATLVVDSRPTGANVFVDGRLIGTTPLLLPNVAAGDHTVRMELAGYNEWGSAVRLTGGERRRVAASLER